MLAIVGVHGKKRVEVTLDASASVAALAEAFAAKLGMPPARVAMTLDGAVLGDPTATLDTAGVAVGTSVILRLKHVAKPNEGEGSPRSFGVEWSLLHAPTVLLPHWRCRGPRMLRRSCTCASECVRAGAVCTALVCGQSVVACLHPDPLSTACCR